VYSSGKEGGSFVGYDVTWDARKSQNEDTSTIRGAQLIRSKYKQFQSPCEKILIGAEAQTIGIAYAYERVMVECGWLDDITGQLESCMQKFTLPLASLVPVNCFNLVDPSTLYKQILP
jgi:hypothetical protein